MREARTFVFAGLLISQSEALLIRSNLGKNLCIPHLIHKMANFTKPMPSLIEGLPQVQTSPVLPLLKTEQPLWSLFDSIFTSVAGYHATDFHFVPGQTPLATAKETFSVLVSYYAIVLGGREVMRHRKPFELSSLFILHNFLLTVVSGALLALFAEQLVRMLANDGLFNSICSNRAWTKELNALYYVSSRLSPFESILRAFET